MKKSDRKGNLIVLLALLAAMITIAAIAGHSYLQNRTSGDDANAVLETMKAAVPGIGEQQDADNIIGETGQDSGNGRDPLPVMNIKGIDVVGCLDVPAIDIKVPVTVKDTDLDGFARCAGGSPVRGRFRIYASRVGVFGAIDKIRPGDLAYFTDMDGIRYSYRALTQFHLKKWDRQEYDLMLCYRTDSNTSFIVAFNRC